MTNTQNEAHAAVDQAHQLAVELGVAIQSMMFRKRVTNRQLGAALGITAGAVSQKLHARTSVSVSDLYVIAGVLGVHPGELLPRLDSNQQPSGYTSPQVSAAVAVYGRAAALWLNGQRELALVWLDSLTADWLVAAAA